MSHSIRIVTLSSDVDKDMSIIYQHHAAPDVTVAARRLPLMYRERRCGAEYLTCNEFRFGSGPASLPVGLRRDPIFDNTTMPRTVY